MSRKEERARINALLESLPLFGLNHTEKTRITTALLDGGYRYNPDVIREAADEMAKADPVLPLSWLRARARAIEDRL